MKPKQPGTILPTAESLRAGDVSAVKLDTDKLRTARENNLTHWPVRTVGGERRYYSSSDRYAIVTHELRVQWFRVTRDGDFAIPG